MNISLSKTSDKFVLEGFPDAVKLIQVRGPDGKRLADLALHRVDLRFALECMDAINQTPPEKKVARQSLWETSIGRFMKCYGGSVARARLKRDDVLPPEARTAFDYFKSLRNKHVVHDENPWTQCLVGAVLNRQGVLPKIAHITCTVFSGDTMEKANVDNLRRLITCSLEWVNKELDQLARRVREEMEVQDYEDLYKQDGLTYKAPEWHDVHDTRPT